MKKSKQKTIHFRKIKEKEVKSILNSFHLESAKEFSGVLIPFKKKYTDYGPLNDKDKGWIEVLAVTMKFFVDYHGNKVAEYNILRFVRLLSVNTIVLQTCYMELFNLYLSTLFDPNGNIRNGGYRILENMKMGLLPSSNKDTKTQKLRKAWMELFFELLRIEEDYTKLNKNLLLKAEMHGRKYRKDSVETNDKFLKNIRRGIEMIDRGFYFDKILEEFGLIEQVRVKEQLEKYYAFKREFKK
ncbi:MAG: hypothetical protein ABIE03_01325 [Patescibacteria group bacterium]|nr:hypothetical protein [Patescibacteria group bacterium]